MLSSILDFISKPMLAAIGGVWGLLGLAAVYLAKKYLVPYLTVERNRRYAEWIARIADELTDELMEKYPREEWARFLDKAVDRVTEICNIPKEKAERAVKASVGRKRALAVCQRCETRGFRA